jgi:hypothetical protein
MSANPDDIHQVEGQWDELIRHSDQFAGRRVRVTVLSGDDLRAGSILTQIHQWLADGDSLHFHKPAQTKPNSFGDALVEKFRKQGLVL